MAPRQAIKKRDSGVMKARVGSRSADVDTTGMEPDLIDTLQKSGLGDARTFTSMYTPPKFSNPLAGKPQPQTDSVEREVERRYGIPAIKSKIAEKRSINRGYQTGILKRVGKY